MFFQKPRLLVLMNESYWYQQNQLLLLLLPTTTRNGRDFVVAAGGWTAPSSIFTVGRKTGTIGYFILFYFFVARRKQTASLLEPKGSRVVFCDRGEDGSGHSCISGSTCRANGGGGAGGDFHIQMVGGRSVGWWSETSCAYRRPLGSCSDAPIENAGASLSLSLSTTCSRWECGLFIGASSLSQPLSLSRSFFSFCQYCRR